MVKIWQYQRRSFELHTMFMLNKLNERMAFGIWPSTVPPQERLAQIASVELTFRLRAPPEQHLLLHCDNDDYDPRSAVFIVGLSNGSAPTVLSGAANVSASDARCRDADPSTTAACASDRAGAATYYPIHACHSRPTGVERRDVVAVHVRWTEHGELPPAEVVARVVDDISLDTHACFFDDLERSPENWDPDFGPESDILLDLLGCDLKRHLWTMFWSTMSFIFSTMKVSCFMFSVGCAAQAPRYLMRRHRVIRRLRRLRRNAFIVVRAMLSGGFQLA
jgi:hypothetical protein